ncbi:MAG TPA: PDDEXK nuclease domain-containing protein [Puia sp.]|nr:PDDEXK nuclease domain-containing protein [Puia sp.]
MLPGKTYEKIYKEIADRITAARIKANSELGNILIDLYYSIGGIIYERQKDEGWGKSVIRRLSSDLRKKITGLQGFSESNLEYMRKFYLEYKGKPSLLKYVKKVPWGHNMLILQKVKDYKERQFYLKSTVIYGWTRNVLLNKIKFGAYKKSFAEYKKHNFKKTLPAHLLGQAEESLKSSYNLEFLNVSGPIAERNLENKMIFHIKEVLLELGYGFTFVGSQYKIVLGKKEYFLDLLFFHRRLQCLVVIELKAGEFKPEYAGKMNFYLEVLDSKVKMEHENPSIGIILCGEKDDLEVEYSLKSTNRAMGVAEYQVTKKLPKNLAGKLPTASELKKGLK